MSRDYPEHQRQKIAMTTLDKATRCIDRNFCSHHTQEMQIDGSSKEAGNTGRNFHGHQKQEIQKNGPDKALKNINKCFNKHQKKENQMTVPYVSTTGGQKKASVYNKTGAIAKSADNVKNEEDIWTPSNLIEKPSNEILLTISVYLNNFLHFLENIKATDKDMVAMVLSVIAKACKSSLHEKIASFLSYVFQTKNFAFCTLPQYLVKFSQQGSESSYKVSLESLIEILMCYSQFLPASASDLLTVVLPLLEDASEVAFHEDQSNLKSLVERIHLIEEQRAFFINAHSREVVLKASQDEQLNLQQPHNNFREISIFPTKEDILECEPFLRPNITVGSYIDTEHYLDVQFRLLREDYVRPFREGIFIYMSLPKHEKAKNKIKDVRIYHNVHVVKRDLLHDSVVHFVQFDACRFKHINWEQSKRFLTGSLLCFSCDNFQTMLFATVADRKCNLLSDGKLILKFENLSQDMLNIDPNRNFIVVESSAYFEAYRHNLSVLRRMSDKNFSMQKYIIHVQRNVETPLYLKSFSTYDMQPLLEHVDNFLVSSLSNVSRVLLLDYNQWPSEKDLCLDRSQYVALRAALTKEFAVIQGPPGTGKTYIGLQIVKVLLHNVSTKKVGPIFILCYTNHALDQFLEGILQFNRNIIRMGGRCANERLIPYMFKNVKFAKRLNTVPPYISYRLKEQNSYVVALKKDIDYIRKAIHDCSHIVSNPTVLRNFMGEEYYHALMSFVNPPKMQECLIMQYWLGLLSPSNSEDWNSMSEDEGTILAGMMDDFIFEEAYDDSELSLGVMDDLSSASEKLVLHGWGALYEKRKKMKKYIEKMLASNDLMSVREVRRIRNIWHLELNARWQLYRYWVKQFEEAQRQDLLYLENLLMYESEKISELKQEVDLFILRNSEVIGMTTTGAAKHRDIIDGIKPQIVVIEEAAEILESHIVTALTANTNHLILIGDHKQLRPKANVYELETQFNLNVSLFERMVNNNVEYNQLSVQHRMRPCIASLLVPHIYPVLENHESVLNFENIRGVYKNMFFLNHNVPENDEQDSQSHSNYYEAEFIVELCIYLLLQGYDKSQITILTTYSGQLFAIRKYMKNSLCREVRVAVVDNFQGEENDIILMSFVRSNYEGKIGFIRRPNRTCVALSRARKGFFCVGNFELFAKKSDLWKKITMALAEENSIGESLRLQCENHPDKYTDVSKGSDFRFVPEGGCGLPCEYRLKCGHACVSKCHPYDPSHVKYVCQKPCVKVACESNHKCPKMCYENCGPCKVLLEKTFSGCEHVVPFPCYKFSSVSQCPAPCSKTLHCGHRCKQKCFQTCDDVPCSEKITVKLTCSHEVQIKCFESKLGEDKLLKKCKYPCSTKMACGHICKGTCAECSQGKSHQVCHEKCTKIFPCGHQCPRKCFETCSAIRCWEEISVKLSCGHEIIIPCFESSKEDELLKKKCNHPCSTTLACGHICKRTCAKCSQGNSHQVCLEKCTKILPCGHGCPGKCYEICSDRLCREKISVKLSCEHEMTIQCFQSTKEEELLNKCSYPCSTTLACGHICKGTCGKCSQGKSHQVCHKKCTKILLCGHQFQGKCYETCNDILCKKKIPVTLSCEHEIMVNCFESANKEKLLKRCDYPCSAQLECGHACRGTCRKCSQGKLHQVCHQYCTKVLQCGHLCQGLCFETCSDILCVEKAVVILLCGHEMEITCFENSNKEKLLKLCNYPCTSQLACGHVCTGTCGKCFQGRLHQICRERCIRRLVCSHQCEVACSKSCPLCEVNCENICDHDNSISKCGMPSAPCREPCLRSCKHQKCTNLCSDFCSYNHCSEPCSKVLLCGHECLGLCTEPCPECIICMPDLVEKVPVFSKTKVNRKKFMQLQECKHVFEVEELETWIEMCEDSENIQKVVCPKCNMVIRKNDYFINSIKRCAMKIEKIKHDFFDAEEYLLNGVAKQNLISFLSLKKLEYPELFDEMMSPLFHVMNKRKNLHCFTLVRCLNVIMMSRNIFQLEHIYEDISLDIAENTEIDSDQVNQFWAFTENTRNLLITFFNIEYLTASETQMEEVAREVLRYELLLWLLDFILNNITGNQRSIFEVKYPEILENLCKYESFRLRDEAAVKEIFKTFGLDVSDLVDSEPVTVLGFNFSENSYTDTPLKVRLSTQINELLFGSSQESDTREK